MTSSGRIVNNGVQKKIMYIVPVCKPYEVKNLGMIIKLNKIKVIVCGVILSLPIKVSFIGILNRNSHLEN